MVCNYINTKNSNDNMENKTPFETQQGNKNACFDEMDSMNADGLEWQHLAGGNIVKHPPVFAACGSFIFLRCDKNIEVYSTGTGEITRVLKGANDALISLQLDLNDPDILHACTSEGDLLRWYWRTGVLIKSLNLNLNRNGPVLTCNLIYYYRNSPTACAFVLYKQGSGKCLGWSVIDTTTGDYLKVQCNLQLKLRTPLVAVGSERFKYIVIVQGEYVFFLNYKTWTYVRYKNAHCVPVTNVCFNPVEEQVATGDERGCIFIWRQFGEQRTMRNSLYHWHHTAITSIAFSASGLSFYSSGHESVLVKWSVEHPEQKRFIPRISSIIRHIAVSPGNEHVAICTDDNGVQFVGSSDNVLKSTLQNFTYSTDEKTCKPIFPIGLQSDKRTNSLVLNGRVGSLQFYSAYTRSLLFNLNIVDQNRLSMEAERILYNVRVTKAAFNIEWMATGEVFNDEQHLPELRLKFWNFSQKLQKYELNTSIELPHEGGFRTIVFSNDYHIDHLLCATVGEDDVLKIWAIENSDNIYRQGAKVWECVAQTNYKNMPIESVCFSQDGSLLGAGFGSTLCIYKANTLKLRAALNNSAGFAGSLPKTQIRISKQSLNGAKNEIIEKRKQLWSRFKNALETDDEGEMQNLTALLMSKTVIPKTLCAQNLNSTRKAQIYTKIYETNELNLWQKLQLLQKLNIRCQVKEQWKNRFIQYLQTTMAEHNLEKRITTLENRLMHLNLTQRFKAKYKLGHYMRRKKIYDAEVNQNLVPIMSLLGLGEHSKQAKTPRKQSKMEHNVAVLPPLQTQAKITHVQCAAGEHAHFIVACTENRVLIWNLLTLRLQSVLRLSVKHLAFDRLTNLFAVVTQHNELHVFQPHVPLPIYQRVNIPELYGIIWLPKRQPKQSSINVDWQAQSTLHFLNVNQEIIYLASKEDVEKELAASTSISFAQHAPETIVKYTTFGTYASSNLKADLTEKQLKSSSYKGALILGDNRKEIINAFVDLAPHTMQSMSTICEEFVKTLLKTVNPRIKESKSKIQNIEMNGNASLTNGNGLHHDDNDNDVDDDYQESVIVNKTNVRKTLLEKTEEFSKVHHHESVASIDLEMKLQNLAEFSLDMNF